MLKSQCFTLLSLHLTLRGFQTLSVLLLQDPTLHLHCFHFFCLPFPPLLLYCSVHLNGSIVCISCIHYEKDCTFNVRIIRVPFPKLLHAAAPLDSLPPPSAAPENLSASLPLFPLAARTGEETHLESNRECFHLLHTVCSVLQMT